MLDRADELAVLKFVWSTFNVNSVFDLDMLAL